jgi:uncharacterized membrane protein
MTEMLTDAAGTPSAKDPTDAGVPAYRDIGTAPLGVKLLSVVVVVGAILDLSLSTLMILNSGTSNLQLTTGLGRGALVAYGIAIGVVGLIAFAIGVGLRAGSALARMLTIVLALIRLVGLGFAMIAFDNSQWYTAIVPAVIYAVVAYYLIYDPDARDYYRS